MSDFMYLIVFFCFVLRAKNSEVPDSIQDLSCNPLARNGKSLQRLFMEDVQTNRLTDDSPFRITKSLERKQYNRHYNICFF